MDVPGSEIDYNQVNEEEIPSREEVDPVQLSDLTDVGSAAPSLDSVLAGDGTMWNSRPHRGFDTLAHGIAESSFCEITRSGGKVTTIVVFEDVTKTKRIRDLTLSRDQAGLVSGFLLRQYNSSGVVNESFTATIARVSNRVSSITGVLQ